MEFLENELNSNNQRNDQMKAEMELVKNTNEELLNKIDELKTEVNKKKMLEFEIEKMKKENKNKNNDDLLNLSNINSYLDNNHAKKQIKESKNVYEEIVNTFKTNNEVIPSKIAEIIENLLLANTDLNIKIQNNEYFTTEVNNCSFLQKSQIGNESLINEALFKRSLNNNDMKSKLENEKRLYTDNQENNLNVDNYPVVSSENVEKDRFLRDEKKNLFLDEDVIKAREIAEKEYLVDKMYVSQSFNQLNNEIGEVNQETFGNKEFSNFEGNLKSHSSNNIVPESEMRSFNKKSIFSKEYPDALVNSLNVGYTIDILPPRFSINKLNIV